jgi:hypothetical protein
MAHYNIILGLTWLNYVNPDIHWPERKWFYRDFIIFVEKLFKEDFEKSLKKNLWSMPFMEVL